MDISDGKAIAKPVPTGTGYGRKPSSYIQELVHVGPGTPMGEYFRRYWHPIAEVSRLGDIPFRVRLLCEDLIVFKDKKGRIGCVDEHCAHRQSSLYYGRIEEEGIRCCYHGWLFDVEGRCLDQAMEPEGGKFRDKVRQPWYPVQELYGIVWVYMGPPELMPLLPRYDVFENLGPDEFLHITWDSLPGSNGQVQPCNWLINMDNIHDMQHAGWLHHLHSGPQFGPALAYYTKENAAALQADYEYVETRRGMFSRVDLNMPDGSIVTSLLETQLPTLRLIHPPHLPGKAMLADWCIPVDDHNNRSVSIIRVKQGMEMVHNPMDDWDRTDPLVVRANPSDFEAQNTQGPIEMHSREHLASGDRGVVKMRRQYQAQLKAMAEGKPLMNVVYEPGAELFETYAGAYPKGQDPQP